MGTIQILQIIFGIALLFLGRRLFWVFVGSIGFITATDIAVSALSAQPEGVIVLIGLAAGIIGTVLALIFQAGAISSILGALSLADRFQLGGWLFWVTAAILALLGILVQNNQISSSEPSYA